MFRYNEVKKKKRDDLKMNDNKTKRPKKDSIEDSRVHSIISLSLLEKDLRGKYK